MRLIVEECQEWIDKAIEVSGEACCSTKARQMKEEEAPGSHHNKVEAFYTSHQRFPGVSLDLSAAAHFRLESGGLAPQKQHI